MNDLFNFVVEPEESDNDDEPVGWTVLEWLQASVGS